MFENNLRRLCNELDVVEGGFFLRNAAKILESRLAGTISIFFNSPTKNLNVGILNAKNDHEVRRIRFKLRHIGRWWEYVRLHRGAERDVHIPIQRNELTLLVNRACKFDLSSPFLNIPYILLCVLCA